MNTYNLTEPKAGDAWRNHIKQFEALDSWFNSLSEVTQLWLSQQIDIFAGKYPISGAKKEDIPSKESQKQSLIELMEADQRDGIYGADKASIEQDARFFFENVYDKVQAAYLPASWTLDFAEKYHEWKIKISAGAQSFDRWLIDNGYVLWYKQEPLYLKDGTDYTTHDLMIKFFTENTRKHEPNI